jgi:hypothetical protein
MDTQLDPWWTQAGLMKCQLLEDAARTLPGVGEVQYHYAAALARSGKNDLALPPLRKALAGDLPPAVRTDAQKLLKQLSK